MKNANVMVDVKSTMEKKFFCWDEKENGRKLNKADNQFRHITFQNRRKWRRRKIIYLR